jgi:hypothetical protein
MVRLAQLALTLALLTGPAQAADKISLLCSGNLTPKGVQSRPLSVSNQPLLIDLDRKTITGFLGELFIRKTTDSWIYFSSRGAWSIDFTTGMLGLSSGTRL